MAVIAAVVTAPSPSTGALLHTITWDQINQDDTGGTTPLIGGIKKGTITFAGTYDSGTWTAEGSIDGTNYSPMYDRAGTIMASTVAISFDFVTAVSHMRIAQSAGTTSDVNVNVAYG